MQSISGRPRNREAASAAAPGDFRRSVRDALRHLSDPAYLQTHALAQRISADDRDRQPAAGTTLRDALLRSIESLHPDARTATGSPARRRYQILLLRYADGMGLKSIQAKLGIGRSEYYREHRQALRAVAEVFQESCERATSIRMSEHTVTSHQAGGNGWERPAVPNRSQAPPLPLARLIGRDTDMAAARQLLSVERLVTLTGPPGVGKTRLAMELARDLSVDFPDGVYFVPLASVRDPDLVVPAIAQAMDVATDDTCPVAESLARSLEAAHALLVLDNFEQVVEAGPSVATLLQRCSRLRILVTSRAALEVRGECEMPVPPLGLPPLTEGSAGEGLTARTAAKFPSVQLFVERAGASAADFELTDQNASTVARLCVRLDGLPLALELAAARTNLLSAGEILDRLDGRFELLSRGPRDLPPRQRTLEAAIDWSYELLGPEEQALLRQLAVFHGSWTLADAQAVAETAKVVDGLATLVRSSLVQRQERRSAGDAQTRFALLETIKEYGRARLSGCGQMEIARRKHAQYFALVAEKPGRPRRCGED